MGEYADVHARSLADPEGFWLECAELVDWTAKPTRALDDSAAPIYRWYPDGELNTCHNALDRHVDGGRADQVALIHDSPVTGTTRSYTYRELRDETARFAGVLRGLGVEYGDRVVVYMPMVPEAVVAMLACARIGAVHSVVFGGFAATELAARIDDATPKVIVAASCGIEPKRVVEYQPLLDKALDVATHRPAHVVMLQRERATATLVDGRDLDWTDLMRDAEPVDCVPVRATDPLYVLYTSGTTGKPKGVVRDNGGHAVALTYSMKAVYGLDPGEVMFTGSDIGWVVGHSYIVYAPLLAGCTSVMYEGKPVGTPDAGAFWRLVADHGVHVMFTAPTAFRAVKKEDPDAEHLKRYDVSSLRTLFLAGERLDPETYQWASDTLGVPVVDHWWQTETGWPMVANLRGIEPMPTKPGSPSVAAPGYDIRVLSPEGEPMPVGEDGDIVVRLPLPPGCLPTLWNDDERYVESYLSAHPGHYLTGDGGHVDEDGYVFVMGRTDDVINVAGHRLSTGVMEEILAAHPAVAECCVVGVQDAMKGQVPRGFVVLKAGVDTDHDELGRELALRVREEIGAIASMQRVDVVDALPKTRSGKILRKTIRGIADGRDEPVPSTIEDTGVLDAMRPVLRNT